VKEIDFLPDWYRDDRRRQSTYCAQSAVLVGVLAVMIMWSLVMAYLVLRTSRELAADRLRWQEAQSLSQEFNRMQSRMVELQKRAMVLSSVDSRIDVANVLAELSFLINEKVVLSKVQITAEKFVGDGGAAGRGAAVRMASDRGGQGALAGDWSGDVRFKVVITGMAVDAGCVADLICRLEDSPYFCLVYPSFSRSGQVSSHRDKPAVGKGGKQLVENYQVSEFEISCYLANYRQQGDSATRQSEGLGRSTAEPQQKQKQHVTEAGDVS
jgi:hypothetical protein